MLFGAALLDYTVNSRVAVARGNQHIHAAPHGVYPCQGEDRWISIAAINGPQWQALSECLSLPKSGPAGDWASGRNRYKDREAVDRVVAEATTGWIAEELMTVLQAQGVPAGVVQNAQDVVDRDPQLIHRKHWCRLDHPEMGEMAYNAPPFRFASRTVGPRSAAPCLGEHTEEVCRELLGLDREAVTALVEKGVLA